MPVYTVLGYERITIMMRVTADSEEEAIEKAKRGEYEDSEPGPKILRPQWTASEGAPWSQRSTS